MRGVERARTKQELISVERELTKQELISILEKLAFYCQEPDAQAKGAGDLAKAMKQFTFWPTKELLQRVDRCVLFLVRSG